MSLTISNSTSPAFKVEPVSPRENEEVKQLGCTPITIVADLQCIFGFRGDPKNSYSIQVAIGHQVEAPMPLVNLCDHRTSRTECFTSTRG